jgi:cullin 3
MPFDLSVNVLTSTYWPINAQAQPCTMGPAMIDARDAFTRFYQSRHSGRILTWHPNLGNADVRVAFRARKHELNVSTYALVVLLLFEDVAEDEPLSYAQILGSTQILEPELQRTLQSLACAKYKILLKEPKGRDIGPNDKFTFNAGFTCSLARIKIAQVRRPRRLALRCHTDARPRRSLRASSPLPSARRRRQRWRRSARTRSR